MPCYYPLSAKRGVDGSVVVGGSLSRANRYADFSRWLYLPCGSCVGCIKSRARSWAIRCSLELQYHACACWATLTYDGVHVPVTLQKTDLQVFMRRLRKQYPRGSVRFFAAGEYGEKHGRPHYHPILYGMDNASVIQDCWPHGIAAKHEIRAEGIAYVAGYVNKKFVFREKMEERVDYSTGEVYVYQPPFSLMSRKPGIGGRGREFVASWRNNAMYHGRCVSVPRYFHEAWKANASWRDVLERACEIVHESKPVDWERLAAGEQIALADVDLQSRRRTL